MKGLTLDLVLACVYLLGLGGCLGRSEVLRDDPEEYRDIIGATYVTRTNFEIYRHPENKSKGRTTTGEGHYYSLYPATEMRHVNNRYSRLLGELPKGARLQVVSVKQTEESKKVAFVVKILESEDEIIQGEQAVIRGYTEHPRLYIQAEERAGTWGLSPRWFTQEAK